MGDRGVQHSGKVFLLNDVFVSLILRDVHELDHFALLVILENGRGLKAEVKVFFASDDHVYLFIKLSSIILYEVIEA